MALRFWGLLKVMTPTPSSMLCKILPSAWDFWVGVGVSSIVGSLGRKHWTAVSRPPQHDSPAVAVAGMFLRRAAARPPRCSGLLHEMRAANSARKIGLPSPLLYRPDRYCGSQPDNKKATTCVIAMS